MSLSLKHTRYCTIFTLKSGGDFCVIITALLIIWRKRLLVTLTDIARELIACLLFSTPREYTIYSCNLSFPNLANVCRLVAISHATENEFFKQKTLARETGYLFPS